MFLTVACNNIVNCGSFICDYGVVNIYAIKYVLIVH